MAIDCPIISMALRCFLSGPRIISATRPLCLPLTHTIMMPCVAWQPASVLHPGCCLSLQPSPLISTPLATIWLRFDAFNSIGPCTITKFIVIKPSICSCSAGKGAGSSWLIPIIARGPPTTASIHGPVKHPSPQTSVKHCIGCPRSHIQYCKFNLIRPLSGHRGVSAGRHFHALPPRCLLLWISDSAAPHGTSTPPPPLMDPSTLKERCCNGQNIDQGSGERCWNIYEAIGVCSRLMNRFALGWLWCNNCCSQQSCLALIWGRWIPPPDPSEWPPPDWPVLSSLWAHPTAMHHCLNFQPGSFSLEDFLEIGWHIACILQYNATVLSGLMTLWLTALAAPNHCTAIGPL